MELLREFGARLHVVVSLLVVASEASLRSCGSLPLPKQLAPWAALPKEVTRLREGTKSPPSGPRGGEELGERSRTGHFPDCSDPTTPEGMSQAKERSKRGRSQRENRVK